MTYEQSSMMIVDGSLISDEALCYFLPRLARAIFRENGNEFLLYRRLEYINKNLFNQKQKILLECLIGSLKEFEKEIEAEEERKLKQWQQEN